MKNLVSDSTPTLIPKPRKSNLTGLDIPYISEEWMGKLIKVHWMDKEPCDAIIVGVYASEKKQDMMSKFGLTAPADQDSIKIFDFTARRMCSISAAQIEPVDIRLDGTDPVLLNMSDRIAAYVTHMFPNQVIQVEWPTPEYKNKTYSIKTLAFYSHWESVVEFLNTLKMEPDVKFLFYAAEEYSAYHLDPDGTLTMDFLSPPTFEVIKNAKVKLVKVIKLRYALTTPEFEQTDKS